MNNDVVIIDKDKIESKIYIIRGQKVMLDSDLAEIYGYTTKAFNQQVKNNIEKFDEDFMFKLNESELKKILRSKKLTSSWGGNRYSPYVFTEQGIYMLMTVLKGNLATKQSKALIRIFKEMKDYIIIDYNSDNEKIYHCGASSKDAGKRINTITEIKDTVVYRDLIDNIMNNQELILK